MCGVYGWSVNPGVNRRQMERLGLVLSVMNDNRGGQSWGFASPGEEITKGLGRAGRPDVAIAMSQRTTMMAHTRLASHGGVTMDNAHPFEIGRIVGLHNGVFSNHDYLNHKYNRNFQVDSQHIFAHINDGLDVEDISGYGAVNWYDKDETKPRIYIARFMTGQLTAVQVPEIGAIWSSDENHLRIALIAAGMEAEEINIDRNIIHYAEDGVIYKTKLPLKIGYASSTKYDWRNYRKDTEVSTCSSYDRSGPLQITDRRSSKADLERSLADEAEYEDTIDVAFERVMQDMVSLPDVSSEEYKKDNFYFHDGDIVCGDCLDCLDVPWAQELTNEQLNLDLTLCAYCNKEGQGVNNE